jgi:hypothetical protein
MNNCEKYEAGASYSSDLTKGVLTPDIDVNIDTNVNVEILDVLANGS